MNQLKEQIETINKSLVTLQAFADKYGEALPQDLASCSVGGEEPSVLILTGYSSANKLQTLELVGRVFGTSGWTKHRTYDDRWYDWRRTIDGVNVTINNAEEIPRVANNIPVHPTEFPLQLQEVTV